MASIYLTAYFTEYGEPKTGLSPMVTVWDVSDGSTEVDAQAMTELSGGWYKYQWTGLDLTKDYVARADGGDSQPQGERYAPIDMAQAAVSGKIDALNNITVADIMAGTVEGSLTLKHSLAVILSALAGKADGGGSNTITFRNQADSVNRISMTVNDSGDRSAITLDVSDL